MGMTAKENNECHVIIHSAAALASGVAAGMALLPCSDNAALVGIEVTMITALAKEFGFTIDAGVAKSMALTTGATIVGRGISQVLVGWIPGIGNAINAATAAGVVEVIGWL